MTGDTHDRNYNASGEAAMSPDVTVICENEAGTISISKSVIAMIVRKYTLEVEGISRFAPQRLVEGLADMLSKRTYERSIQIDFSDGGVIISLTVIANFGYPLVGVVQKVQAIVKERVEEVVDIKVRKVNVFVKDLEEFEESQNPEEETSAEA